IFQPAEEGVGGARAMIEDGLFDQFPCDKVFAMHNAPGMPVGNFGTTAGTVTAAGAFFDIDILGTGAHGAFPDDAVDPVVIAGELIGALQSVVSRNVKPSKTAVVSVTQVHGGDAYNVIPATVRLSGTVRTFEIKVMELVRTRMRGLARGISAAHGAKAEVDFRTIFHPVVNDSAATTLAADVCDELVGEDKVLRNLPPGTGSEDFSFMLEQVPGCYLLLGNSDEDHTRPVHNPGYDFNDKASVYGASFFARVVETMLATEEATPE
ncbi:MAG: amidohydrolase, partial [Pseudomonadales bacterium]